jgi:hypothetical protein
MATGRVQGTYSLPVNPISGLVMLVMQSNLQSATTRRSHSCPGQPVFRRVYICT